MKRLRSLYYLPIILGPIILFSPLIMSGEALFWGTSATQFIPWWDFAWDAVAQGQLPLWNPWVGMGAPLAANYQSAIFYPPYWFLFLIYIIAGLKWMSWSLTFVVIFHLIWSGVGTARILGELKLGKLAQIVGGLAFSLSGYLVARAGFLSINAAAAWLPWMLLYSYRLTNKDKKAFLPLGISTAFLLLAGHAQTAWYTIIFSGIWVMFWSINSANSGMKARNLFQDMKEFILAGLLGAGISAIQLIPTAEYLLQSQRAVDYGYAEAMTYSFWPWRFLTLFLPDLFGNPARGNYWGYGNFWEDAVYIGLLPIMMALGHVIKVILHRAKGLKRKQAVSHHGFVIFLGISILVSFLFALGDNTFIYPFLFKYIPTFNLFQAPTRFSIWAVMSLSLLAGLGVDAISRPTGRRLYWMRLAAAGFIAVMGGALLGWIFLSEIKSTFFIPMGVAGIVGFGTVMLTLYQPGEEQKGYLAWNGLLVLLVMGDLIAAGWGLNPGINAGFYDEVVESNTQQRTFIAADLEYDLKFNKYFRFDTFEPEASWSELHADLLPNLPILQRRDMVNNFDPLVPARYQEWMQEYNRLDQREQHQMTGLMNISLSVTGAGTGMKRILTDSELLYGEVRLNSLAQVLDDEDEILENILAERLDFENELILLAKGGIEEQDCQGKTRGKIDIVSRKIGYLELKTDLEESGWILWSQSWYPGWRSRIDGVPAGTVQRGNYLFQAVCVPSGNHAVEFIYQPYSFYAGGAISLVCLGVAVAVAYSRKMKVRD